jgi:hypothetical protein
MDNGVAFVGSGEKVWGLSSITSEKLGANMVQ